jgi:TRAP transporter TAXI family solute receptor
VTIVFSLVAVTVASLTGCQRESASPPRPVVRVMTGIPGGAYYALSQALAEVYARAIPGVDIKLLEGSGSVYTLQALQRGDADVGFAFADATYLGSIGRLPAITERFDRLRAISVLQVTPLHLVVRNGIRRIEDLAGRRIGLGPPNSGTSLTAGIVLAAFKLTPDTIKPVHLSFADAATALLRGKLDAMFAGVNYPAEPISKALGASVQLLAIEGPQVERLRSTYPFLRRVTIVPDVYPGQTTAIRTIGVDSLLVCRSDLPDDLVYQLTRNFYEALRTLSAQAAALRFMDVEQGPATPIPLHSGAARYFRERELVR